MQIPPSNEHYQSIDTVDAPVCFPDAGLPVAGPFRHEPSTEPIRHLHRHDALELGLCLGGGGVFVVNSKLFSYRSGDICVVSQEEMHLARSAEASGSAWVFIYIDSIRLSLSTNESWIAATASLAGERFRNVLDPSLRDLVAPLFHELIRELETAGADNGLAVRALATALICRLHRSVDARRGPETDGDAARRIAPAVEYLTHHYDEAVRVPDLAEICATSESTLRRLFRQVVGRSPRDYLVQLRVHMAVSLLENTERTVLEIGHMVGFSSLSSLNRHFRKLLQITPSSHRRMRQK